MIQSVEFDYDEVGNMSEYEKLESKDF